MSGSRKQRPDSDAARRKAREADIMFLLDEESLAEQESWIAPPPPPDADKAPAAARSAATKPPPPPTPSPSLAPASNSKVRKGGGKRKTLLLALVALLLVIGGLTAILLTLPLGDQFSRAALEALDHLASQSNGAEGSLSQHPPSGDSPEAAGTLGEPLSDNGDETSSERRPWLNGSEGSAALPPLAPTPAAPPVAPSSVPAVASSLKGEMLPPPKGAVLALPLAQAPLGTPRPEKPVPEKPVPDKLGSEDEGLPREKTPLTDRNKIAIAEGDLPPPPVIPPPESVVVPAQPLPGAARNNVTFASLPSPPLDKEHKHKLRDGVILALHLRTTQGIMPVVEGGRDVAHTYARPFTPKPKQPLISVMVTGLGLSKEATEAAITKLPPEVTLAFSPYADDLQQWVKMAWLAGHEVLLILPGETDHFPNEDPGPLGLLSGQAPDENIDRLEHVMGRAAGPIGVTAYGMQGQPTFPLTSAMDPVFQSLKDHGMLYIGPGHPSGPGPLMTDAFIKADDSLFQAAIDARLVKCTLQARHSGACLAIIGPSALSYDRVLAWAHELNQNGFLLAPASAQILTRGQNEQATKHP